MISDQNLGDNFSISFHSDQDSDSLSEDPDFDLFYRKLTAQGPAIFCRSMREQGLSPTKVFTKFGATLPDQECPEEVLWILLQKMLLAHYYQRQALSSIASLADVIRVLRESKRIVFVVGAGISVSSGIPDFRSATGLYQSIKARFAELESPEDVFDLEQFKLDPKPFFSVAKELIPDGYEPTKTHYFLRNMEAKGQVLRVYTQNIDTLEEKVGLQSVCYCHGSFRTCTCLGCGRKYSLTEFSELLFRGEDSAKCELCENFVKPDIVFFGESLPDHFDECLENDIECADCLVVIGSSMKVHPVSAIPDFLPPSIPQILINKEPHYDHNYDAQLLGDADTVIEVLNSFLNDDFKMVGNVEMTDSRWILLPGANHIEFDDSSTCSASEENESMKNK